MMKVDVILPAHNGSLWIEDAITSIFEQTYDNWHITIVDDLSSDNTVERVDAWRSKYPSRISLIQLDKSYKAAGARMKAISESNGEVITFIDQDDRWSAEKLARQIDRLNSCPTVCAVHTDVVHMDINGKPILGSADYENSRRKVISYDQLSTLDMSISLFNCNTIRLVSAAILRKPFLEVGGFNVSLFGGEDWEFWVRFSSRWRVGHISEPLIWRRLHERNCSVVFNRIRGLGLLKALEIAGQSNKGFRPFLKKRKRALLQRVIMSEILENYQLEARRHAWELFKEVPICLSEWIVVGLAFSGVAGHQIVKLYKK